MSTSNLARVQALATDAPVGSIQSADVPYIATLRARGVSDQNIAKITGYSTAAVRRTMELLDTAPVAREPVVKIVPPAVVVRDMIRVPVRPPTGREIAAEIAALHGLTLADMAGPSRLSRYVHARQHAMWAIRTRTSLSLPLIGQILGDRDHTTILHGVRAHERRMGEGA